MAFQAGAKTVTLKGRWLTPDGLPNTGKVSLSLDTPLGEAASNTTYTQTKRDFPLDNNGEISTTFVVPSVIGGLGTLLGTKVKIVEEFEGTKRNTWYTSFTAEDAGAGNIIWLSSLSQVEVKPFNQYVSISTYNLRVASIESDKASRVQTGDTNLVSASINALVRRDSSGRIQALEPTLAYHTATKNYTDTGLGLKANTANPNFTGTMDASNLNIATDTTVGTIIGTNAAQKLGFFAATPVAQQASGNDLGTVLSNLGLRVAGSGYPISTSGNVAMTGGFRRGIGTQTAASTTLTTTSQPFQVFNITANSTVTLPSTATSGVEFYIRNNSTFTLTTNSIVLNTGTAAAQTIAAGASLRVVSTATAGTWYSF